MVTCGIRCMSKKAGIILVVITGIVIYGTFTTGMLTPSKYVLQNTSVEKISGSVETGKQILGNIIEKTADVSKWQGTGLHTIYVYLTKPSGEQVSVSSLTLEYLK